MEMSDSLKKMLARAASESASAGEPDVAIYNRAWTEFVMTEERGSVGNLLRNFFRPMPVRFASICILALISGGVLIQASRLSHSWNGMNHMSNGEALAAGTEPERITMLSGLEKTGEILLDPGAVILRKDQNWILRLGSADVTIPRVEKVLVLAGALRIAGKSSSRYTVKLDHPTRDVVTLTVHEGQVECCAESDSLPVVAGESMVFANEASADILDYNSR